MNNSRPVLFYLVSVQWLRVWASIAIAVSLQLVGSWAGSRGGKSGSPMSRAGAGMIGKAPAFNAMGGIHPGRGCGGWAATGGEASNRGGKAGVEGVGGRHKMQGHL